LESPQRDQLRQSAVCSMARSLALDPDNDLGCKMAEEFASLLPTGVVTFLFTDVEGSTALWATDVEAMAASLALHDEILREVVAEMSGYVFTTAGDSFAVAFQAASDAVNAAKVAQERFASASWPGPALRVRMGLHLGETVERGGDYFGELAAIDGRSRSASVMALTDSLVASLPKGQFLALLGSHPTISMKVIRRLTEIVRTATDRIMDLSTLAANNRVRADLLRLAKDHMKGGNEAEISPIPMHSDITSRASTTRETVARVLSDLAHHGIVERQKEMLLVMDVEQLSDMVEEVRGE